MAGENKLQEVIETSLESLRSLVDSNTIIGKPIETPSGTTVIPVSKITLGLATGGLDYASKRSPVKQNFGGGGGTGLSVLPVGFLVVKADGNVEMLHASPAASAPEGTIEQIANLIDRSPELFAKVKSLFHCKKDKSEEKAPPADKENTDTAENTDDDTVDVKID